MINSLWDHIAKYKVGYIATAIAVVLGISVWSYNRIPDFEALKLAGRTGPIRGTPIQIVSPAVGATYHAGDVMRIEWSMSRPQGGVSTIRGSTATVFDIYLRTAGSNSGIVANGQVLAPRKNAIEVARRVRGTFYDYIIRPDLIGSWRVVVLNQQQQMIGESEVVAIQPPLPDLSVSALRFELDNELNGMENIVVTPTINTLGGRFDTPYDVRLFLSDEAGNAVTERGWRMHNDVLPQGGPLEVGPFVWEPCDPDLFDGADNVLLNYLSVSVDDNNEVEESDETNNVRTFAVPTDVREHVVNCRAGDSASLEITRMSSEIICLAQSGGLRQVARYRLRATGETMRVSAISIVNDLVGAFDAPANTTAIRDVWLIDDEGHDWGQALVNGFATPQFVVDVPVGTDVYMNVHARVVTSEEYGPGLNGQTFRLGVYETVTPEYANGINVVGAVSGNRYQIGDGITVVNQLFGESEVCSVQAPVTAGTLTIRQHSSPMASTVLAGTPMYLVAEYELAAAREAFVVNKLTVMNDVSGAFDTPVDTAAVARVIIDYPAAATVGVLTGGVVTFSGLNIRVPQDSTIPLRIYADVQSADFGPALNGMTFRLGLQDNNIDGPSGTFSATGETSALMEYNPSITGAAQVYTHTVAILTPVEPATLTITRVGGDEALMDGLRTLLGFRANITGGSTLFFNHLRFNVDTNLMPPDDIINYRIYRNGIAITPAHVSTDFTLSVTIENDSLWELRGEIIGASTGNYVMTTLNTDGVGIVSETLGESITLTGLPISKRMEY